MSFNAQVAKLRMVASHEKTNIYTLNSPEFSNRYFVISSPGSRALLSTPEMVGFPCYTALLEGTTAALSYLLSTGFEGGLDILTILRGGLNYPLEESCDRVGIRVRNIHFLSCERIIRDKVITGLEIKYEKLTPVKDAVLAIGDIIASGATLRMCLQHVIEQYHSRGGSIRRLVFFTIGGTYAIELMEEMTPQLKALFPGFEGFDCFFHEGVFTVYDGPGASGINVRDIDFGWNGGIVAPEFRALVAEHPETLLEKCIIYDGGARRYEILLHLAEVSEYWEGILERADIIDIQALVGEKLGYPNPLGYERWMQVTGVPEGWKTLWEKEQALLAGARDMDLEAIARRRLESIASLRQLYI